MTGCPLFADQVALSSQGVRQILCTLHQRMPVSMKKPALILVALLIPGLLASQAWVDVEAGVVGTGYNDVRIPGNAGTFFSLPDDLKGETEPFFRMRAGYRFGPRSEVLLLYAPLRLTYEGDFQQDVFFFGETFPARRPTRATYTFNSYRATYRYHIIPQGRLTLAAGLTVKVRDALIGLYGDGIEAERTDLGPVPLIHFLLRWQPHEKLALLIEGDALAAPGGRAEDVMVAVGWQALPGLDIRGGYRLLEGGADNARVYTFSLLHYALLGATLTF